MIYARRLERIKKVTLNLAEFRERDGRVLLGPSGNRTNAYGLLSVALRVIYSNDDPRFKRRANWLLSACVRMRASRNLSNVKLATSAAVG